MHTPPFESLLDLIGERSAALREAAGKASPGDRVPGCPDWSLHDLVAHLGEVQRFWAAVVTAGPGRPPPADEDVAGRVPGEDLLGWSEESTRILLRDLAEAGPDRGCWTWWQPSGAPQTAGAVARHQVQEAAVHARDAQEVASQAGPLPLPVAVDGVAEYLEVALGSLGPWPGPPGRIAFRADEGGQWHLGLGAAGAAMAQPAAGGPEPGATIHGSASDLVLFLYGRSCDGVVRVGGDRPVVDRLLAWALGAN